jgi:hypothetical protein
LNTRRLRAWGLRAIAGGLLGAVVATAFGAYLAPEHVIDWLLLGSLCG